MSLGALINAIVASENGAADDLLLEALRVGGEREQAMALDALIRRGTTHGLCGVIAQSRRLPETLHAQILRNIRVFHHALRECGRSDDMESRRRAIALIAAGRQGKLAYVLSENLLHGDAELAEAAMNALVDLAQWIACQTAELRRARATDGGLPPELAELCHAVVDNRGDVEAAILRALDLQRGRSAPQLVAAALMLCEHPGSRTLQVMQQGRHAAQTPLIRRLQQPPEPMHIPALLIASSHGPLRPSFAMVLGHLEESAALDALLERTHWLKDQQAQSCVRQVTRGVWWGDAELQRDIDRRPPEQAALIGEWLAASGMHDVTQDQRIEKLLQRARESFPARLRLFRIAQQRRRGASTNLLRLFLTDADERLVRMAARELAKRRPPDYESTLLQLMTSVNESVRRVISRAIGQAGFEAFWRRFDRVDRATRRRAGAAMVKLLPDLATRLARRLSGGPVEQRVKALLIASELDLAESMSNLILPLCGHPNARLRSKAIAVVGQFQNVDADALLRTALDDADARVRANAIEVLEEKRLEEYVPLLTRRARSAHNRERANAIKALQKMRVGSAVTALETMLTDARPEHRISGLWVLRQIGWWRLMRTVAGLARDDSSLRVRRYALAVLRVAAENARERSLLPPSTEAA